MIQAYMCALPFYSLVNDMFRYDLTFDEKLVDLCDRSHRKVADWTSTSSPPHSPPPPAVMDI